MKKMSWTSQIFAGALLALGLARGNPTKTEHTFVSEMHASDLEGSETGYAYEERHGVPVSFVRYTSHTGSAGSVPYDGTHYPSYTSTYDGIHYPSYASYNAHPASYAYGDYGKLETPSIRRHFGLEALAPYYAAYGVQTQPYLPTVHRYDEPVNPHHRRSQEHEKEEDESSEEVGGAKHHSREDSVHGAHGEKGYEARDEFDRGEKEHHDAGHDEGHYQEEAGHEVGHVESDSSYDGHDEGESAHEGASYGKGAYHKKGHRTTGFHNVYHKDEYKKNTDFYDEEHNGGEYEKYGALKGHRESEVGGYANNGKHDEGYEHASHGREGYSDKGYRKGAHVGHEGAEGEDSYREEHADYASKTDGHHGEHSGFKRVHGYR